MILIQAGLFPLVINRDEKKRYIDALEAADGGDLKPHVDIIARFQRTQFRKATAISEAILTAGEDIGQVMAGLLKAANDTHEKKRKTLERVFEHAHVLEDDLRNSLETLIPGLRAALR